MKNKIETSQIESSIWIDSSSSSCILNNKIHVNADIYQPIEPLSPENFLTPKKKTTEFSYLLERKAFRMMKKYFKDTFESFAK